MFCPLRSHFYILALALAAGACRKDPSLWHISNLNDNHISVFGHGGMGIDYRYPMNSMRSLNEVLAQGADGTEMDVELTTDNVLVLYHSEKLQDETACSDRVREHSWSEISGCHYKLPLTGRAPLIKAEDFFAQRSNLKQHVFTFDCRVTDNDDPDFQARYAKALYDLIQRYELADHCLIESYNVNFLKLMEAKKKELKLFIHSNTYAEGLALKGQVNLYGITIDRTAITAAEVEDAHKQGLRITIYNLDHEKENLDGIKLNPDFMQTDMCDYLMNALK